MFRIPTRGRARGYVARWQIKPTAEAKKLPPEFMRHVCEVRPGGLGDVTGYEVKNGRIEVQRQAEYLVVDVSYDITYEVVKAEEDRLVKMLNRAGWQVLD